MSRAAVTGALCAGPASSRARSNGVKSTASTASAVVPESTSSRQRSTTVSVAATSAAVFSGAL
ncbi:hypothetical protein ACFXDH_18455 [Streptomyces sp. NPDC059467]|uniref:hypothetical protein n=1 Tax=Streptomyces sp. NPDC059467 TaxID=3346844 RepID=UPI0036C5CAB8